MDLDMDEIKAEIEDSRECKRSTKESKSRI